MKYSLLSKDILNRPIHNEINNSFIYDLSIDKCINSISSDFNKNEYFLRVLDSLSTDVNDILFRQDILLDFIENPNLFNDLKTIFIRYDKIKSDWIELRSGINKNSTGASSDAVLDHSFNSLKITSIFPKTILSFYQSIKKILDSYDIHSEGLKDIQSFCNSMIENNSFNEISEIASLFQYKTVDDYNYSMVASLTSSLELSCCELSNIVEKNSEKKSVLAKIFKKADNNADIICQKQALDNARYLLTKSFINLDDILSTITNTVYDIIYGISEEMYYYEVSINYCSYLSNNNVEMSFPKILEANEDVIEIVHINDLYLICNGKPILEIISNDVNYKEEDKTILIQGINNSGKTTFLRSFGIAQVFAQAGLPICATKGKISIRNAIFSHFSSSEEFIIGDTSGRFEGEVQKISKIVNNIQDYSLVILNETFQTTSYDEGTNAIFNILNYLSSNNCKTIFVTHLLKLFDMMNGNNTKKYSTVVNGNNSTYILKEIK